MPNSNTTIDTWPISNDDTIYAVSTDWAGLEEFLGDPNDFLSSANITVPDKLMITITYDLDASYSGDCGIYGIADTAIVDVRVRASLLSTTGSPNSQIENHALQDVLLTEVASMGAGYAHHELKTSSNENVSRTALAGYLTALTRHPQALLDIYTRTTGSRPSLLLLRTDTSNVSTFNDSNYTPVDNGDLSMGLGTGFSIRYETCIECPEEGCPVCQMLRGTMAFDGPDQISMTINMATIKCYKE